MISGSDLVSGLYAGSVRHQRSRPRPHRLSYRIFMLLLDLDELPALHRRLRLFSWRGFNFFSFHESDHGDGSGAPLREWVETQLTGAAIDLHGGPIRLLAMPRVFGYGFNPISIYFCYHVDQHLMALLYEVHNTFGERHTYVIPVASDNASDMVMQECDKSFHVSPFIAMGMSYSFRVHPPDDQVSLTIRVADMAGPMLVASFAARRQSMTDGALLKAFVRTPLLTLKVIGGIHWEALRLWCKGLRLYPHPPHPGNSVRVVSMAPADADHATEIA